MDQLVSGIIRKFDASSRHGFLVPRGAAAIDGEILIHESSLNGCSEAAVPGSHVECLVRRQADTRQRVLRVVRCVPPRGLVKVKPTRFDTARGLGAIEDVSGREITVTTAVLADAGWTPDQLLARPAVFAIVSPFGDQWQVVALYPIRQQSNRRRTYRRKRSRGRRSHDLRER